MRKKLNVQVAIASGEKTSSSEVDSLILTKSAENRKLTAAEKHDKIIELSKLGYTKTQICREINMDLRFYERLIAMTPSEREKLFSTNLSMTHEEKIEQKMKRVNEIRELKSAGFSNRAIARRTGLDFRTVAKYIRADFNPVHAAYGRKRAGKLTPYMREIDSMLDNGMRGTDIILSVQAAGYTGSSGNVRHYISYWKKRRKHLFDSRSQPNVKMEIMERNDVFKLLFHPLEKVECISGYVFEKLCSDYPCFKKVHNIVWEFKILLASKKPEDLASWLKKAKDLKIREITSFVEGIKRDYDAVSNAIKFDYSNGLAEGKVNKLKLVKRIMYGRCQFSTLRSKVLLIENSAFFQLTLRRTKKLH